MFTDLKWKSMEITSKRAKHPMPSFEASLKRVPDLSDQSK